MDNLLVKRVPLVAEVAGHREPAERPEVDHPGASVNPHHGVLGNFMSLYTQYGEYGTP